MRRYLVRFWSAFLALMMATAVLNAVVDPYDAYRIGPTTWNKHKRQTTHWIARGAEAARGDAAVLLAGDSRALNGLSPHHPGLQSYGRVYNIAVPGSSLMETQKLLELAVNSPQPPRLIIWSMPAAPGLSADKIGDDFEWSEPSGMHHALERHLHYLLSLTASNDSLHAIGCVLNGHRYELDQGFLVAPQITSSAEQFGVPIPKLTKPLTKLEIDERVEGARKAIESLATRCQQTHTELMIVFPPVHANFLRGVADNGGWAVIQGQKSAAVQVAANINRSSPTVQVWDFHSLTGLNNEPVASGGGRQMKWYFDASHFSPNLGDRLISRVLGTASEDPNSSETEFGQQLTSDNLLSHLAHLSAEAGIDSSKDKLRIADASGLNDAAPRR